MQQFHFKGISRFRGSAEKLSDFICFHSGYKCLSKQVLWQTVKTHMKCSAYKVAFHLGLHYLLCKKNLQRQNIHHFIDILAGMAKQPGPGIILGWARSILRENY